MWKFEIDVSESFNNARHNEGMIPALVKDIRLKLKNLNPDIDSYLKLKLDMAVRRLTKTKTFRSFNTAWSDFMDIADAIRLWVKTI